MTLMDERPITSPTTVEIFDESNGAVYTFANVRDAEWQALTGHTKYIDVRMATREESSQIISLRKFLATGG